MERYFHARAYAWTAGLTHKAGKELMVFVERIDNQVKLFLSNSFCREVWWRYGKFQCAQYRISKKDWKKTGNEFVESLGLQRLQYTTQIEHYDYPAAHFDAIKRINNILIDLCRDMWMYISMEYFRQKIKEGEVGSSAMPHKVNPIDFENAEGNLGVANALLEHFAAKLPISRLQRDLTDSTVLRNLGVPMAHTIISLRSIEKGLEKIVLNEVKLNEDLESNWAVVAEAIQTSIKKRKLSQSI
jgi:adenylosuccinate lyase